MFDQARLPRFRTPPVFEVGMGIQFNSPELTPVHLGLYFQKVKERFPNVQVKPPLAPSFETFGPGSSVSSVSPNLSLLFGQGNISPLLPRMWFISNDDASLIQLQSDRLFFNWRSQLKNKYPHFDTVQSEFSKALDVLESLIASEGLSGINVNQCELVYVNMITDVSFRSPENVFRMWNDRAGDEWQDPPEDLSFNLRYRFDDEAGNPFGRLIVSLKPAFTPDALEVYHLQLVSRGQPLGDGHKGIFAFHDHAHQAIVRSFTALTTPEMHKLWERY